METSLGSAIGGVIGVAVGVAVSPVPIAAVILMLLTERARVSAPMFLLGWLLGLSVVTTVVVLVPGLGDGGGEPSTATGVLKAVLGVLLALLAVRQFRHRPGSGEPVQTPRWMARLDSMGAVGALGLGAALSGVNPKNLLLAVAAGATIGAAELSAGGSAVAIAVFVAVGSVTILAPVVAYLLAGRRLDPTLARTKDWLIANNATVLGVLFVVFAAVLVGDAVRILTA